jgi:chemotaxis family two-component system response regulator Rcp1
MHVSGERRITALVVEDNPADVFLIRAAVESHEIPLDLHVVADGDLAYEFIDRADTGADHTLCPDVVLLDLNFPKGSGKEVLARLRQSAKCSAVPVLILTSSDNPKERDELLSLGANRYFRKPSGYGEFLKVGAVLKELLAEHRLA